MALPTTMKVLRAMRTMKKASVIARGRLAKALVFRGSREKTVGGLRRDMLMRNKRGKIVSKRAAAAGRRRYVQIQDWVESCVEARAALRLSGFVAVNAKSIQGKALYVKTKAIRMNRMKKLEPTPNMNSEVAAEGGADVR